MGKFDLVEQASIYGSYHNTIGNRIIHFIFVPLILLGVFLWLSFYPFQLFRIPFPHSILEIYPEASVAHIGWILSIIWSFYCFSLEPLCGVLLFLEFGSLCALGSVIYATYGFQQCIWIILWTQIIGWGAQIIIGHGYFEGRKPALLDSLFQVFVAPFFLVLETLFLFGYRQDLKKKQRLRSGCCQRNLP